MPTLFPNASSPRHLTGRQRTIIQEIAKTAGTPVPVQAVAEKLKISSRTVLRDLPAIEEWMDENDFRFVRRPGVGLLIEEDSETLSLLNELLAGEQGQDSLGQKERRRQLLGELLFVREPVKSYVFQSRFHVSAATLAKDLEELDRWLSTYRVRVVTRSGRGICLEGKEGDFRQAIANAALEFMTEGEVLKILRGSEDTVGVSEPELLKNRLFSFVDPQIVGFVEQILTRTEKTLGIKYTDSGYMALIVHLSLAIRRLRSGEKIEMVPEDLRNLEKLPEYPVAAKIAGQIEKHLELTIPKEEIGFITMHLSSARIWPQSRRPRTQVQSVNTHQVVMAIVEQVEQELDLPFHTCTRMIEELTSHMDSMISRLTLNIHVDNAQEDSIRRNYPDVYRAVEKACGLFCEMLCIDDISSAEVTFVAMHFAAAAETLREEQRKISAAVVCPSGMGASRMLAANLMRSARNIEIRRIMSAFSLNADTLREEGIDLVISTVPLDIDFPSVCVSPIPQAQDMLVITHAVNAIREKRSEIPKEIPNRITRSPDISLTDIRSLTRTGEEIAQLLDHFQIQDAPGVRQISSLLGQAAGLFADSIMSRQIINQELARRETVKNTYIPELKIYLLHCRTTAVLHCRFGYLRLLDPIASPAGNVDGAVLLLAPLTDWNECVEVISRISMLLVDNERFLKALKAGDVKLSRCLAEQALSKYYQDQIQKRKGDEKL